MIIQICNVAIWWVFRRPQVGSLYWIHTEHVLLIGEQTKCRLLFLSRHFHIKSQRFFTSYYNGSINYLANVGTADMQPTVKIKTIAFQQQIIDCSTHDRK
jgi:hypothetical protein